MHIVLYDIKNIMTRYASRRGVTPGRLLLSFNDILYNNINNTNNNILICRNFSRIRKLPCFPIEERAQFVYNIIIRSVNLAAAAEAGRRTWATEMCIATLFFLFFLENLQGKNKTSTQNVYTHDMPTCLSLCIVRKYIIIYP